jgi:signal transduction histidine kinase
MLNLTLERNIRTNKFYIKVRWYYMFGILLIGVLSKTIGQSNAYFSPWAMSLLMLIAIFFNIFFHLLAKRSEENKSEDLIKLLSISQISFEVAVFLIIMHFSGGIDSVVPVFYFLPIVAASLLLGSRGAFVTVFFSALLVNLLVIGEYFGFIPHIPRYADYATIEFTNLSVALSKTISISIYYAIVAWFTSYSTDIIFRRERMLEEKTEQMDDQTRMLIRRDMKLLEANQSLLEEKNKVSSIISNFTDPIILLDSQSQVSFFNPSAEITLGFDSSVIGQKIAQKNNLSFENFRPYIKYDFEIKPLDEGGKFIFPNEEVSIKLGNEEKIYKVITAEVFNEEHTANFGYIKIFYDLTREKTIDRLKSEFISIAAHQLRTPLTSIKWVIKMAMDGDAGTISDEQKDLLYKGYVSNERVIKLVNDLLNVSRIEEGRFGYTFQKMDFQEILNTVIENVEGEVAKKHIKLVVNKSAKIPKINIDKVKMIMAMQNLVDNAIKYSPDNTKVEITINKTDNFFKVIVKDNGMGIPAKDCDKLFTKFFRAGNVAQGEIEGTGLGLFIVKNIIDRHGGVINIKSQEGIGTEISFLLPL